MPANNAPTSNKSEAASTRDAVLRGSTAVSVAPESGSALPMLTQALHMHLEMLAQQLQIISDDTYINVKLDPCFGSCIGSHVRHLLDHIRNLVQSDSTIDYEARRRGDRIESSRAHALHRVTELQAAIRTFRTQSAADGTIRISVIPAPGLAPLKLHSTLEREFLYVIDHTIHHLAMIRTLLSRAGHSCPSTLGLAAGTPSPCAR